MTIKFEQNRQNTKVFGQIQNLEGTTKKGLRQGMFRAGRALIDNASKEILNGRKTGKLYVFKDRLGRRRRHRASAPGETHANLTGALRRSLSFQLRGTKSMEFGYGVSSGKPVPDYSKFVEFGTVKMAARPSLKNALNAEQGNLVQHFENGIRDALR